MNDNSKATQVLHGLIGQHIPAEAISYKNGVMVIDLVAKSFARMDEHVETVRAQLGDRA